MIIDLPGTTTAAVMTELGLPTSMLGVDVIRDGRLIAADAQLLALLQAICDSEERRAGSAAP